LSTIVDRNESCGQTFVTTDGGGHHMLRATGCLLERSHGNFPIAIANKFSAPRDTTMTVTGCLATPHDLFGEQVGLPSADVGDVVALFCAGAYGPSASPRDWESRPAAKEMLV
jgi:diaminopimelate decarboxylase